MELQYPHFLWLLLIVPGILAWSLYRRRPALSFPGFAPFAKLPSGSAQWARWIAGGTRALVVALLIVGLSRPRWPVEGSRLPAMSAAIQLVLDISGSMNEPDFALYDPASPTPESPRDLLQRTTEGVVAASAKVSRLQGAKYSLQLFIDGRRLGLPGLEDDLVGLLTFAARSEMSCPPTLSHEVVLRLLREARSPEQDPREATTNIGDAMVEALAMLARTAPRQKLMVLVTDGLHNVPKALKPRQAAQIVRGQGVRVYTVYVGPEDGRDESAQAKEALRDVAELTGGEAFTARDTSAFIAVCRQIAERERTPIESFRYRRYHEAYPWVGLACIVLMLGLWAVEGTRWRRAP